ncbi:MAG: DUF4157 domain-containing protein [Kofleriaceae bacterium]
MDAGAEAGSRPWAPLQARAMTRHTGKLASMLRTPPVTLPFRSELEGQFSQSLDGIEAHVGEVDAVRELGGGAAAEGDVVAFGDVAPSRGTVAHEVTHVLQARSGNTADHAGAEAEADQVKASVATGGRVGPIMQGARGVHLDASTVVDPKDITARELLVELHDIFTVVLGSLRMNKVAELHPFARYLKPPVQLPDAMFSHPAVHALIEPFHQRIDGLIAPEPVEAIVDKARAARTQFGAGLGPPHHVYMDSVGFALGNALTRKLQQSLHRMLPRYVLASKPRMVGKDIQGKDWWVDDGPPEPTSLAVSHPLDRIVAYGLCASSQVRVDVGLFAAEHPELVKVAGEQVRASRDITLKFPWERKLWHWVEASPSDATAEEVARALFGSEDQAYRLTPMAPLFGFRNTDVGRFVPARKQELDTLAAAHHPQPQIANQAEIAAITSSHTEQRPRRDNRFDGIGEPGLAQHGGVGSGFPNAQQQPEHGQPAAQPPTPIKVYPVRADVDPAVELAEAQGGATLARDRAKLANSAVAGAKHDEASVYERATDCIDLIAPAKQAFVALGLSTASLDVQLGALLTTQREATQACFPDPEGEFALVDQQAKMLKRISEGAIDTAAHLPLYGGVSKKDGGSPIPDMKDLPAFARGPVEEAAQAFESAASALTFPEVARPRVERAEYLKKMLRISVLEQSLHQTRPTLQNAMDTQGDRRDSTAKYDPDQLHTRNDSLLVELSKARVELEHDPAAAEKQFAGIQERAGDYTFEVAIVSNLESLDAVWGVVEGTEDFWKSGIDTTVGNLLQANNDRFYRVFRDQVFTPYKDAVAAKDKAKKDAAKKIFNDLVNSDEFQNHFKLVQQHLKDDAKHKKWTKIAVGIAIAVVAMGLGQVYFGAYLAAGGGVLGAAVGGAVIETGVGAVLNKLILDSDPTAGGLITGLVGGGAMYAILGKALTIGRAAGVSAEVAGAATKASLLQKTGALAVATSKELLMVQAIGMVQGQIANLIDHGKLLTEEQLKEMFIHNIAGLVGMKIGQRLVDVTLDPMKPLRDLGKQNAINVDALIAERTALRELADKVHETTDPAARKLLAEQLVDREKAFLENVRETRDRLIELAEKNPAKVNAGKLKDLKAMPEHVQDAEVVQSQAFMSLEEIGPNLYRADAKAFDSILALHKQSGDKLVGVHTDKHSGLRSLEFQTADGALVKVKEKLANVGERAAPPVPAAEARRFEHWLESEMTHPDLTKLDASRQRLRDYYARDPLGAMAIAEGYGFRPQSMADTASLATKPTLDGPDHPTVRPKSDADRAFDQHLHDKRGDEPQMSRVGEEPIQSRSDFEAMYKAGFEYDPVARRWALADGKTAAGQAGHVPPELARGVTSVIGSVHSEAVGQQMLRKIVNGEAEALRLVGIEPPAGFDTRGNEWALGRRTSDGEIVLIRGGKGEVNWSEIPGVVDLAHSHPLHDPITGKPRLLQGPDGNGVLDLHKLSDATYLDMLYLLPSTGDLRYVALNNRSGHRVHTPYVSLGEGRIGNPTPGHSLDTVEFVIAHAEPHALLTDKSEIVIWKAEVQVWAGDTLLKTMDLYQRRHQAGSFAADLPVLRPEAGWATLPANHPVRKATATSTPTSTIPAFGFLDAPTMQRLVARGIDPTHPDVESFISSLSERDGKAIAVLSDESLGGRVSGFEHWWQRSQTGGHKTRALADARLALTELQAHPNTTVTITPDGAVKISNPARDGNTTRATPDEVLRTRNVPEATIQALALDTMASPPHEAVLTDLGRTYQKLASEGLVTEFGPTRTHEVLSALLTEPNGARILEIIGSGQLDKVHGFDRILSQLFTESNRQSLIVVLERAVTKDQGLIFEPQHTNFKIRPGMENKEQRTRREAAEKAGELSRIDRGDVDLGVVDGTGGWSELYQMKLIEQNPRVGPGVTVRPLPERVSDAANKAAIQIKFADESQIAAGRPPARKIVEIRAEAPRNTLDPSGWAADFVRRNPGVNVEIYSTEGGAPWKVPP